MTTLEVATPARPDAVPVSATALAARIGVPRRLPTRYDGQPLGHLSPSSYTRFLLCPEDWRRHYLLGERFAPNGAMFLGSRVDDTLTLYYRQLLERREALALDQLRDAYRDRWFEQLEHEEQERGIHWEPDLDEQAAFQIGLDALELTFAEQTSDQGRGRRSAARRSRGAGAGAGIALSLREYGGGRRCGRPAAPCRSSMRG